jgi:hypothetical protein
VGFHSVKSRVLTVDDAGIPLDAGFFIGVCNKVRPPALGGITLWQERQNVQTLSLRTAG